MMRLQKYLARSGVASRRASEDYIVAGRVSVNGQVITELGTKVDENADQVLVDEEEVFLPTEKVVLVMNKPCGYVTTMSDPQKRKTVADLIDTKKYKGFFPVGRLDLDTSGLLLLTNDGDLAAKLMHPSSLVKKTYVAEVKGKINEREFENLMSGVDLGDFVTSPAEGKILKATSQCSMVELTIHEGKNRQVRRMCKAVGHEVNKLQRVNYANITLDGLAEGMCRELTEDELKFLRSCV